MMKIKNTYSLLFILFFGITFALRGQENTNLTVTGTVLNASNNKPLAGINIRVGQYSSVLTDSSGKFSMNVPDNRVTLIVTNPDYQTKEVALKGRTNVEIKLYDKSFNSYYTQEVNMLLNSKSNTSIVNSVSTKKGDIATPKESLANVLNGELSGVRTIMRSGVPGIGANIFIRGYNTINGNTQPLIIVDGMMLETNTFTNNSLIGGYSYDPLSDINPKDIANITVIKDAASIYGSRGANGVILIETNKAESISTKIDFYVQGGLNVTPNNIPMMNSNQYRTYLSDQMNNSGLYTNDEISRMPFFNENTSFEDYEKYHNEVNWQDQVFSNNYVNDYYLRVTGGDEISKYGLSVGYTSNKGVVKNSEFDRFTTRFNAETSVTEKLFLNTNLSVSYTDRNVFDDGLLSTSPIYSALNKSPFLAPFVPNADGVVTDIYEDIDDIGGFSNPVAITDNTIFTAKDYNLYGHLKLTYQISDKLNFSTLIGANYIKNRQNVFLPDLGLSTEYNEYGDAQVRTSKVSAESLFAIYNDTRLNYVFSVDKIHDFSLNLGLRYNQNNYENSYSTSGNSGDDQFTSLNSGDRLTFVTSGSIGNWKYASIYANADYSFLNKFFVSYNLSVDASSRFGDAKSAGFFPSLGAAWLISSENFMANSSIDQLKLRASYGLTGNDGIGNYNAESYFVSTRFLEGTGLINGNIANSSIRWEETTKANLGLDIGLLNERLSFNIDYFNNVTDGLLNLNESNPVFGSDGFLNNDGKLRNTGFELGFNARVFNTNNFTWDIGGNIAHYKNEIVSLPGDQQINNIDGLNATILNKEGSPLGLFYGYKTDGIYNNDAEATAAGLNYKDYQGFEQPFVAGDVRFVNSNSDNIIDEDDRVVIGDPNPDFTGMVYNTFTYKKLSLSAVFSFSQGNDVYNALRWKNESMSDFSNQSLATVNRWSVNNQDTNIPRAVYGDAPGNSRFSDRWIEDGSYIRLKTISLSYTPDIFNATFYITANNILTITDYLGYDPEVSTSQVSYLQGIDAGFTPQYSSVLIGVRVGL
ncbi:SusC/RagA family TonB-linked outer membrane protein [Seonamhaeicola sp. NFXS20]|uniref:SusC/RagA family TonB-linked outer membrane protein n=1 Tax=Seonamhaeicola sp. NFXS20 TaxID=2816959 RepID=UPI003B8E1388